MCLMTFEADPRRKVARPGPQTTSYPLLRPGRDLSYDRLIQAECYGIGIVEYPVLVLTLSQAIGADRYFSCHPLALGPRQKSVLGEYTPRPGPRDCPEKMNYPTNSVYGRHSHDRRMLVV